MWVPIAAEKLTNKFLCITLCIGLFALLCFAFAFALLCFLLHVPLVLPLAVPWLFSLQ